MQTPDQQYPELFSAVQMSGVFADSKTFVDLEPLAKPEVINRMYIEKRMESNFDLRQFLNTYFVQESIADVSSSVQQDICKHIKHLWPILTRQPNIPSAFSSRLALNYPYVVPGGRFNEIYYWDSYFTQLGLALQGELELFRNMVANFADLIDRFGFIPNGNRSYFCTRSQPPFFALMVELLSHHEARSYRCQYYEQLEAEYRFWMDIPASDDGLQIPTRCVQTPDGLLNRYWDAVATPRQESYLEDLELAHHSSRDSSELYRDLRAGAESGWDFSSRWCNNESLNSIRTTEILPIDLNSLMYLLENTLLAASEEKGDEGKILFYRDALNRRASLIQAHFFNERLGYFVDLNLSDLSHRPQLTLATLFPLFANIATQEQAAKVALIIEKELLADGGWLTTTQYSGEQWDAPNGWAPLQWICFVGLRNYGFDQLAEQGARRWLGANERIFQQHGKMIEKYNVLQIDQLSGGGEYAVQDGFGWSNGVYIALRDALGLDVSRF